MFIFIDITTLSKVIKRQVDFCITCQCNRELSIFKTYQCLRIFFIPLWHWGEKYYVLDEICKTTYQIKEEDAILVQYDKKDISTCTLEEVYEMSAKCSLCHKALEHDFVFCPYCGGKRK